MVYLPNSDDTTDTNSMAYFAQQVATRYNGLNGHGKLDALGYNEDFGIHHTVPGSGFTGTHVSSYQGLYGDGASAITTSNKWEPARDFFFASPVVKNVWPAVRGVSGMSAIRIGAPVNWWKQPKNVGGIPNTPISAYTASAAQLYADGCKGNMSWLDPHLYTNAVDPMVGSNQCSTFPQMWQDLSAVIKANTDSIPVWVSEFGWQVPDDCDEPTQNSRYSAVYNSALQSNGVIQKMFFYTLDYKTSGSSHASLVYWNGSSYSYRQAFTTLKNFIANNPQFPQPYFDLAQSGLVFRNGKSKVIMRH